MGTTLEISVYRTEPESADSIADLNAAYAEIADIDRLMSLYRGDSELVRLNSAAGSGMSAVSAKVFDVLSAASHYTRLSSGALDVTVQPLVDLWGFYDVSQAKIPSREDVDVVRRRIGMDRLSLDAQSRRVSMVAGTALDLGGIAKGYAVDRAVTILKARGVPAGLVNLGGNVGVFGQREGGQPWLVGIRHPRTNSLMAEVQLLEGAVATSGDYDRYFEMDGKRYSHILDPRTGWPVEGVLSLTVVAPNATAADALSTAAFVLGPDKGLELLARCADVEGILVQPDGVSDGFVAKMTSTGSAKGADQFPQILFGSDIAIQRAPTGLHDNDAFKAECVWPLPQ